jgi:hypothetical protein
VDGKGDGIKFDCYDGYMLVKVNAMNIEEKAAAKNDL